ncbi:hypothetical protein VTH82DRAFT_3941 [Thermothelomyces myriococcoides]
MALNRIDGSDELYIGGVFGLNRPRLIQEYKITHILSVIKYSLNRDEDVFRNVEHLSIDIDDMEDQDILVHLPRMVRFIDSGLRRKDDEVTPVTPFPDPEAATEPPASSSSPSPSRPGAVLVHCAMGKSRSATAVIAYLLWKYPDRFGGGKGTGNAAAAAPAQKAVLRALDWVRRSRPIAEPNEGFMRQLEMWWDMGRPADSDDAVERHPAYQRWLYKREVEDAARVGRAPDRIRFEDEAVAEAAGGGKEGTGGASARTATAAASSSGEQEVELRCKKCRRVLATGPFIVSHQGSQSTTAGAGRSGSSCPHYFVEALSWMRPILEEGELDGRLTCPNTKCSASIGRYAWQGFKCSCGEWVAPAFSLQTSKVDKVITRGKNQEGGSAAAALVASRMAALGIRMPPGMAGSPPPPPPSVAPPPGAVVDKSKENL